MRKRLALSVLALLLPAAAFVATARGDENGRVMAVLNGYQEVVGAGSISTAGAGTFSATINEAAGMIAYELRYTLENPATVAHIHLGVRHSSGGVIAFLCGGGGKDACPPGTTEEAVVTGVIVPEDIIGPNAQGIEAGSFQEAIRAIRAGATYANVHSSRWPSGEIRGQIADLAPGDLR